jgi:hypothetical protein
VGSGRGRREEMRAWRIPARCTTVAIMAHFAEHKTARGGLPREGASTVDRGANRCLTSLAQE